MLSIFRLPLDLHHLYGDAEIGATGIPLKGTVEVTVRYLAPHNKWAIRS